MKRHGFALPATSFLGRAAELAWLEAHAGAPVRTLVGPPGIGKTRLALEHAARVARRGDAVRFCDLANARDRDGVIAAVASGFGATVPPGSDPASALGDVVETHGLVVVVLDNAELAVDAVVHTLVELHRAAPLARFVVTSRERLRLAGELVCELGPLAEAGELFRERARAWCANELDAGDVAAIVGRLEGAPLALELAAARLGVLGTSQLLARLDRQLDVLSGIGRDARATTLRAAIAASWEPLPLAARRALADLSVFRGGFTLDAAEVVVSARPVLDLLDELRARSLVRCVRDDGALRFGVFESIREFASEHAEVGSAERHARYFAEAGTAWAAAARRGDASAFARLGDERDNFLAVHRRATELGDHETAARIALALDPIALARGPLDAHLGRLTAALDHAPAHLTAELLLARGNARLYAGQIDAAGDDLARASACAPPSLQPDVTLAVATWHMRRWQFDTAASHLDRALADARAADDRPRAQSLHGQLGVIAIERGDHACARTHLGAAAALLELHGASDHVAATRLGLRRALLAWDACDAEAADRSLAQAIASAEQAGDARLVGFASLVASQVAWEHATVGDASSAIARAIAAARRAGDIDTEGMARAIQGALLATGGDLERAEQELALGVELVTRAGCPACRAAIEVHRGHAELARSRVLCRHGELDRAGAAVHVARARIAAATAPHRAESPDDSLAFADRSSGVRAAVRLLSRALAAPDLVRAPDEVPATALVVARDGRWCRLPDHAEAIDLARSERLRRIVRVLAEHRAAAPGHALTRDDLIDAGWPGEAILPDAAASRLYVALSTLRKLGLREVLVTDPAGYLLDPEIPLFFA